MICPIRRLHVANYPPPPSFIYRLKGNVILYIIPKFSILRNYILDKSADLAFGFPLYFKNCRLSRDHLSSCQQGFISLKHRFLILSHYQHLWNFFNYCCNFESTYVKVLPFFLNIRMKRHVAQFNPEGDNITSLLYISKMFMFYISCAKFYFWRS